MPRMNLVVITLLGAVWGMLRFLGVGFPRCRADCDLRMASELFCFAEFVWASSTIRRIVSPLP